MNRIPIKLSEQHAYYRILFPKKTERIYEVNQVWIILTFSVSFTTLSNFNKKG